MPTATQPDLPSVPVKRYFSLDEAAQLAGVDAETFRSWEAEFADSAVPAGGRRQYRREEVLAVRRLRVRMLESTAGWSLPPGPGGERLTVAELRGQLVQLRDGLAQGFDE